MSRLKFYAVFFTGSIEGAFLLKNVFTFLSLIATLLVIVRSVLFAYYILKTIYLTRATQKVDSVAISLVDINGWQMRGMWEAFIRNKNGKFLLSLFNEALSL